MHVVSSGALKNRCWVRSDVDITGQHNSHPA